MKLTGILRLIFSGLFVLLLLLLLRWLLPLIFPFLLGGLLAYASEPGVRFLQKRGKLPRWAASFLGVSLSLICLGCLLMLLFRLAMGMMDMLGSALPDLTRSTLDGLSVLRDYLLLQTERLPQELRLTVSQCLGELFSGGSSLLNRLTDGMLSMASGLLSKLPDSALALGTCILAAYMISFRFPAVSVFLKKNFSGSIPKGLCSLRHALWGYAKAQSILLLIIGLEIWLGLRLLQIPHPLLWAVLIALIDSVPVLGTGTVLLPWAFINLLQGNSPAALGLTLLFAITVLSRTFLEPKLLGRQLGVDSLLTLLCLYLGFRLFGFWGLIFAPVIAAMIGEFFGKAQIQQRRT